MLLLFVLDVNKRAAEQEYYEEHGKKAKCNVRLGEMEEEIKERLKINRF
jgi:hypothetical protein